MPAQWRATFIALGGNGERCYDSTPGKVNRPGPKVIGTCPACGHEYPRLRRIRDAYCTKHPQPATRAAAAPYTLTWRNA